MADFHDGELAVQEQAGVRAQASRLVAMLAEPDLDGGGRRFLAPQRFAAISARDADGTLWTSALVGPAGFLDGRGKELDVRARPRPGDPLFDLTAGGEIGLVAIEFAARRRMRVNGTIGEVAVDGFRVDVEQAYGNCPQYIHRRDVRPGEPGSTTSGYDGATLTPDQMRMITNADTFFFGSTHPTRGTDASHRGGPAGFVHVQDGDVWWPDYSGNNMFNSLGNLAVDPAAALLFVDFTTGKTVHLTGTAVLEWHAPGETGRQVRFTLRRVVAPAGLLPIHV